MVPFVLAAFALVLPPAPAWSAPPGCPGVDAVLAGAAALGADVEHAQFGLEGRIDPAGGVLRLELEVWTPSGRTTRTLDAETCEELTAAASLVLSVAIDPLSTSAAFTVPTPPEPEPVVAPEPDRVQRKPPRSTWVERPLSVDELAPQSSVSALVGGAAGRGLSPVVDGRLQLGATVDVERLRVELVGFHAFAQRIEYDGVPGLGADVSAWGGALRAGPRFERRAIAVQSPFGVEVAGVVGSGFGAVETWSRSALAWSLVAAPGVSVRVANRVRFGLDVEGSFALRRPAFVVDSRAGLYRVAWVGVRGGARLEVRLSRPGRDQNRTRRRPR